jgi:hypothetical protein
VLISACCDINEVAVCAELHQGSKPVECVWGDARCRLDGILQLVVIGVEDDIGLPLLVHVIGVPQGTELRSQWFKGARCLGRWHLLVAPMQ